MPGYSAARAAGAQARVRRGGRGKHRRRARGRARPHGQPAGASTPISRPTSLAAPSPPGLWPPTPHFAYALQPARARAGGLPGPIGARSVRRSPMFWGAMVERAGEGARVGRARSEPGRRGRSRARGVSKPRRARGGSLSSEGQTGRPRHSLHLCLLTLTHHSRSFVRI